MSEATELLSELYAPAPSSLAEIRLFTPAVVRLWGPTQQLSDVDEIISRVAGRGPIYHGVCPKSEKGSCEHHASGYVALVLDHDQADLGAIAHDVLRRIGLPPSAVVSSGRGFHAYVMLNELTPVSVAKPVARRLQAYLHDLGDKLGLNHYESREGRMSLQCVASLGGDRIHDAARVLRTPGSVNAKTGTVCTVVELNARRFSLDEVVAVLDAVNAPNVTAQVTPCAPPSTARAAERRRGPSVVYDFTSLDPAHLEVLWHRLSPHEQSLAQTPEQTDRHNRDFRVACALARAGATELEILWYAKSCEGLRQKLVESGGPSYWQSTAQHAVNQARGLRKVVAMPWEMQSAVTWGDVEVRGATIRRAGNPSGTRVILDLELDGIDDESRHFKTGCALPFFNERVAPMVGVDYRAMRGRRVTVSLRVTPSEFGPPSREVLSWYAA